MSNSYAVIQNYSLEISHLNGTHIMANFILFAVYFFPITPSFWLWTFSLNSTTFRSHLFAISVVVMNFYKSFNALSYIQTVIGFVLPFCVLFLTVINANFYLEHTNCNHVICYFSCETNVRKLVETDRKVSCGLLGWICCWSQVMKLYTIRMVLISDSHSD